MMMLHQERRYSNDEDDGASGGALASIFAGVAEPVGAGAVVWQRATVFYPETSGKRVNSPWLG